MTGRPPRHPTSVLATWAAGAPFTLTEAELDHPIGDQVLVDIDAVGVCHADLAARDGAFPVPLPALLGHEGTGTVRATGPDVRRLRVGERVVLTYDSCHRCRACLAGRRTQCDHYLQLNFGIGPVDAGAALATRKPVVAAAGELFGGFFGQSSFASLALASERNAVVVDEDVAPQLLAPLGCAVQTGAGAVLNVARPGPGSLVTIVGLGPVGFAALTAAARFSPARTVVAIDRHAGRLELARELGADLVLPADGAFEELQQLGGADVIVESSGAPEVLPAALPALRTGGTLVVVGAPRFGTTAPVDVADVVNRSITIRGTVEGDSRSEQIIPWLAGMVARGRWPLEELIRTYPLADAETAAADMAAGRVIKPVLLP